MTTAVLEASFDARACCLHRALAEDTRFCFVTSNASHSSGRVCGVKGQTYASPVDAMSCCIHIF